MRKSWNVRLTEEERDRIQRASKLAKRTASDFVRLAADAEAQRIIGREERKAEMKRSAS